MDAETPADRPETPTDRPSAADAAPPRRPAARRILLVEDNEDIAETLQLLLELDGHRVQAVPDGPAALALAREARPDLVLCDLGLEGEMDGYEVCRRLRAELGTDSPTIAAMTGFGREEYARRAREAGFDAFLLKPVEPGEIQALLPP